MLYEHTSLTARLPHPQWPGRGTPIRSAHRNRYGLSGDRESRFRERPYRSRRNREAFRRQSCRRRQRYQLGTVAEKDASILSLYASFGTFHLLENHSAAALTISRLSDSLMIFIARQYYLRTRIGPFSPMWIPSTHQLTNGMRLINS